MLQTSREPNAFVIRTMTKTEVNLAVDWAAAEGWNPGLHDAECFYAADPNGFFLGELDGQPVATASAVIYDDSFAFLGFYIVKPECRDRGFGSQLTRAILSYVGNRNTGLDGVIQMYQKYEREMGFSFAYRNVRYEGTGRCGSPQGVVDLSQLPFEALAAYDRQLFLASRPQFLRCWIQQPEGAAVGVMREDSLVGYTVLRACRTGFKIGPLFADDEETAELLFRAASARVPGSPLFLDVPQPNAAAVALAERHGMKPVFETARMYSQGVPDFPLQRVFGVTSFELG